MNDRTRIAQGVDTHESQRLIREHKDSNPTLREILDVGGRPTGEFDVFIQVEDDDE